MLIVGSRLREPRQGQQQARPRLRLLLVRNAAEARERQRRRPRRRPRADRKPQGLLLARVVIALIGL